MNKARNIPGSVAAIAAALYCLSSGLLALELRQTAWESAAGTLGLDPYLVYAVALVESRRAAGGDGVAPWPWAMRTSRGAVYASSRHEAVYFLRQAAQERDNVDVGIMQISTFWHGHRVKDLADLLDPEINVRLGAEILREAIESAPGDLELGVGRYHSWSDAKARKYGRAVLRVYASLLRLEGSNRHIDTASPGDRLAARARQKGLLTTFMSSICGGIPMDRLKDVDWSRVDLDEWIGILTSTGKLPQAGSITIDGLTGGGNYLDIYGNRSNAAERASKRVESLDTTGIRQKTSEELRAR